MQYTDVNFYITRIEIRNDQNELTNAFFSKIGIKYSVNILSQMKEHSNYSLSQLKRNR